MAFLMSLGLGTVTLAYATQDVDKAVGKVVKAYQKANCKAVANGVKSQDHQLIVDYLQQHPEVSEEYISKMAPTIYAKLQQCGMN